MVDLDPHHITGAAVTDAPVRAGSTGFVLSFEWEADDSISRAIGNLDDYLVAVTPDDGEPFDAMVRLTEDGYAFEPWDTDTDAPTGDDLVFFNRETISGLHVY